MAADTIKWFNESKDFGFIAQDDDGEDVLSISALPLVAVSKRWQKTRR